MNKFIFALIVLFLSFKINSAELKTIASGSKSVAEELSMVLPYDIESQILDDGPEKLDLLKKHKISVNAKTSTNFGYLIFIAIDLNKSELVNALVNDYNADLTIKNSDGLTPHQFAKKLEHQYTQIPAYVYSKDIINKNQVIVNILEIKLGYNSALV